MRVALVTCFNADWHHGKVPSPYVPLNLLTLAAHVRAAGHEPVIVDQTLALFDGTATDGPGFHRDVADFIAGLRPDVIGFTTMCNSYPQTLALAGECRERDPEVKIVLGGPQATVVDVATLTEFAFVDAVVRNEADVSLNAMLGSLSGDGDIERVPGVTWRRPGGAVVRNPDAPLLQDLDDLPYPAYDLYPFDKIRVGLAPVEAGRGCPYGCTFCSTNVYFNRRHRIKSPERLVTEMRFLHQAYGFSRFDLVHDMLTVDRRWVRRFCEVLRDGGDGFSWGCSARTDRVDDALLSEMAEAGCMGVFFGVETGAQALQPAIKKRLDVSDVLPVMSSCVENGISPTASFITGFPDETVTDALDSFGLALDVLELSQKTSAQMHLLAPLTGSPLHTRHRDDLRFDGHSSDISLFLLNEAEISLVRRHPAIFANFYFIPTPHLDRELAKAVSAATYTCPLLFIALRHAGADPRRVLTGWTDWQRRNISGEQRAQDYYLYRFVLDLCAYVKAELLPELIGRAPYLPDLVEYFEVRYALQRGLIPQATVFRRFDWDVQALSASLRGAGRPPEATPGAHDLLFVDLKLVRQRGYVFLETSVPRTPSPLVRDGDVLEIRDIARQLVSRPQLVIRNVSQQKGFTTRHHLTERHLRAMGLVPERAASPV
ncbi:B12-binding domain-containing radical SAM protein [Sphaerisporangium dianthi]|uniref:B12-binding domain-containing radical SAM protein n=1 Tax=Sphaerisporangium dianthi TaxID=1436120 RepID=A0ABV9CHL2_9ACTN